jgi:hypothetical protein
MTFTINTLSVREVQPDGTLGTELLESPREEDFWKWIEPDEEQSNG